MWEYLRRVLTNNDVEGPLGVGGRVALLWSGYIRLELRVLEGGLGYCVVMTKGSKASPMLYTV